VATYSYFITFLQRRSGLLRPRFTDVSCTMSSSLRRPTGDVLGTRRAQKLMASDNLLGLVRDMRGLLS